MVLWRDPLEGWYALIALREGSWLRAMDFKLSLTPFLKLSLTPFLFYYRSPGKANGRTREISRRC